MELIAKGDDDFAVVFEDDVKISHHAFKFFKNTDWIPATAELIKLETQGKKVLLDKPEFKSAEGYSVARLRSSHILSAGYIISKAAAIKILPNMSHVSAPIDHFLFNPSYGIFNDISHFQFNPALCIQSGLESTLDKDRIKVVNRPKGLALIYREIKRSGVQVVLLVRGMFINMFTSKKWIRIPYSNI